MWTPWSLHPAFTFAAAFVFAVALCMPLARAAYRLPRQLDPSLRAQPGAHHGGYRLAFYIGSSLLALACAWRFGATPAAVAAVAYSVVLLVLAWIDAETGFLPDVLTLPLLWLGLLVNLDGAFTPLSDAVVGAAAGYLALWLICGAFMLVTKRQGMGHGDFKLVAALGAWLGWAALPWLLLIASVSALAVVLLRRLFGPVDAHAAFSFGPYLALVGIAALLRL